MHIPTCSHRKTPPTATHVLSALLGRGDPELVGEVDTPLQPSRAMYAGLDAWMPIEGEVLNELGLRRAGADATRNLLRKLPLLAG